MTIEEALQLLHATPRSAQVQSYSRFYRVFAWATAAFSLFAALAFVVITWTRLQSLEHTGVVINAKVVGKYVARSRGPHYFVTVGFRAQGAYVQSNEETTKDFYDSVFKGETVPVTAMPDNPHNFQLGHVTGNTLKDEYLGPILLAIGCALLFNLGAGVIEFGIQRELKLLRFGEAVAGTVVSSTEPVPKGQAGELRYSYECAGGHRDGTADVLNRMKCSYAAGDHLVVMISPNDDRKSLPIRTFRYAEIKGYLRPWP